MNPKNPQAAGELREQLTKLHARMIRELEAGAVRGDVQWSFAKAAEINTVSEAIAALSAPAIAPGGDALAMPPAGWRPCKRGTKCTRTPGCICGGSGWRDKCDSLTCAEYGCDGGRFCYVSRAQVDAELAKQAALPAAANAGAVDDAMVERAMLAFNSYDPGIGGVGRCFTNEHMRRTLVAALAPAARSLQSFAGIEDRSHEIQFNDGLDDSPADPPAAGDDKYMELIYAVGKKWPGETRHETALRYIRQAEDADHGAAQEAARE